MGNKHAGRGRGDDSDEDYLRGAPTPPARPPPPPAGAGIAGMLPPPRPPQPPLELDCCSTVLCCCKLGAPTVGYFLTREQFGPPRPGSDDIIHHEDPTPDSDKEQPLLDDLGFVLGPVLPVIPQDKIKKVVKPWAVPYDASCTSTDTSRLVYGPTLTCPVRISDSCVAVGLGRQIHQHQHRGRGLLGAPVGGRLPNVRLVNFVHQRELRNVVTWKVKNKVLSDSDSEEEEEEDVEPDHLRIKILEYCPVDETEGLLLGLYDTTPDDLLVVRRISDDDTQVLESPVSHIDECDALRVPPRSLKRCLVRNMKAGRVGCLLSRADRRGPRAAVFYGVHHEFGCLNLEKNVVERRVRAHGLVESVAFDTRTQAMYVKDCFRLRCFDWRDSVTGVGFLSESTRLDGARQILAFEQRCSVIVADYGELRIFDTRRMSAPRDGTWRFVAPTSSHKTGQEISSLKQIDESHFVVCLGNGDMRIFHVQKGVKWRASAKPADPKKKKKRMIDPDGPLQRYDCCALREDWKPWSRPSVMKLVPTIAEVSERMEFLVQMLEVVGFVSVFDRQIQCPKFPCDST